MTTCLDPTPRYRHRATGSTAIAFTRATLTSCQPTASPISGVWRYGRHSEHAWPRRLRLIGKGDKERTVILSADPGSNAGEAARAFITWLLQRTMLLDQLAAPTTDHIWLIPTGRKRGQPLTPPGVRALFRNLSRCIGATAHPHLLRHPFATHDVRNGARLDAIQRALGHASLATTGMYLHASEDDLAEVASLVSASEVVP